jgi:hypothetical protein
MSQEAYTCIEQLDLAAQQLDKRNPSYARFAIILIDNVIELITHSICSDEITNDDLWIRLGDPKLSSKQRQDALGQRFDRKIAFCRSRNRISNDEAEAIHICHRYRNELYHAGLKYKNVVWDIADFYYQVAVSVLEKRYSPRYWSSASVISPAVERHAGMKGKLIAPEMKAVAESLRSIKPATEYSLRESLSEAALERIEETQSALDFLVSDGTEHHDEKQTLRGVQFENWMRSDDSLVLAVRDRLKRPDQLVAARTFLEMVWTPKYSDTPLPAFEKQAKSIHTQKSELDGLKSFERFRSEFSFISELLEEAASSLDNYIQMEIDRLRGK